MSRVVSAVLLALPLFLAAASAQPPAAPRALTAEQQEQLKERDRLGKEADGQQAAGKLDAAIAALRKALAIERRVFGDRHLEVARSLETLGQLHAELDDYPAAATAFAEALAIKEGLFGNSHWKTTDARLSLAQAEHLGKMAPGPRKRLLQAEADFQRSFYLFRQGKTREAEQLAESSAAVRKAMFGATSWQYGSSLNNLGGLCQRRGDYAGADRLFRQALAIQRKELGDAHPLYAGTLNNLAALHHYRGDLLQAEPSYVQALAATKKSLGENHPRYAAILNNLAGVQYSLGNYAKAEALYLENLALRRKLLGKRHVEVAGSLNNLAALYQAQDAFAKAEPLMLQACEIYRESSGQENPEYARGLGNLGALYQLQGRFAEAGPRCRQALEIRKRTLGETHPDTLASLDNWAKQHRLTGDSVQAESLARQCLTITAESLDREAAALSERQQFRMAETLRYRFDAYLSVALEGKAEPARIAPLLLQAKGAVFVRQRRQRQMLALAGRDGDGDGARCARELDQASRRLATLHGTVPKPEQREAWRRQIAELAEARERLEADLSRLSVEFGAEKARARLTPEQLRDRMPEDAVLVDLHEYRHDTPDSVKKGMFAHERRLLALVLRRGQPLALVPLGPAAPIAQAIERWRQTLDRPRPIVKDDDPARFLRQRLWEPLAKHLAGAKTVVVAPDGATARLPFAALPGGKPGSYLIEEVQIAVLPVPQLLAELLARPLDDDPAAASLLVVGAVDYDAETGPSAARTPLRDGAAKLWKPLEGTRAEMTAIKDSFEQRFPDGKVRTLRGAGATEEAFRTQAVSCRSLHIATHGFFAESAGKNDAGGEASAWNPGLRSGLVFAGANRVPAPERDDGVLTALEVQALDLRKAETVVLSACETGLGEAAASEGALGLQRAFQIAGARTTVTSLWSIDDKETQQLMTRFYANRWERKLPALDALTEAQRWMLAEGPKRGLVRDAPAEPDGQLRTPPRYWAAFVLSGDWR